MTTKHIRRWQASASLSTDTGMIAFEFDDGSSTPLTQAIPSSRLAAVIAVLESSQAAYFTARDDGTFVVSNSANAPGAD